MKRLILIFVLCGLLLPTAYGRTISHTFPSGNKYVGEVKGNKLHGQGTYIYVNGDKYVGEFKDSKFNGQGTYTWANGDKYVGSYKNGKQHGQGVLAYADGSKYVGEFKNDLFHGQGTETWVDDSRYVGEYRNGKKHGQGTAIWAGGLKDVGEWRYDTLWSGFLYDASGKLQDTILDGLPELSCKGVSTDLRAAGFAVNKLHVVTSAHAISCCNRLTIRELHDGFCLDFIEATIVAMVQESDLGLLRLEKAIRNYGTLRGDTPLHLHQALASYDDGKGGLCDGYEVVGGKVTKLNWLDGDSRLMETDLRSSTGSSGGPVLDKSGHIVGVIQGGRGPTETHVVKSHLLQEFLDSNRVGYKTAPSSEKLTLSEIKKRADKFTVLVECLQ